MAMTWIILSAATVAIAVVAVTGYCRRQQKRRIQAAWERLVEQVVRDDWRSGHGERISVDDP